MTEQNRLQIVREIFDAFLSSGDTGPLLDALSEDVEFRLTVAAGTPLSGVFRGKEGVRQYFLRNDEVVRNHAMEVLSYLAGGEQVAVIGRETLTVKRSGAVMADSDWVTLIKFRDNRITQVLVVEDTSAIAAAYQAAPEK